MYEWALLYARYVCVHLCAHLHVYVFAREWARLVFLGFFPSALRQSNLFHDNLKANDRRTALDNGRLSANVLYVFLIRICKRVIWSLYIASRTAFTYIVLRFRYEIVCVCVQSKHRVCVYAACVILRTLRNDKLSQRTRSLSWFNVTILTGNRLVFKYTWCKPVRATTTTQILFLNQKITVIHMIKCKTWFRSEKSLSRRGTSGIILKHTTCNVYEVNDTEI